MGDGGQVSLAPSPLGQLSTDTMVRALGAFLGLGDKAGVQSLPAGVFVRAVLRDKGEPEAEWPLRNCSSASNHLSI